MNYKGKGGRPRLDDTLKKTHRVVVKMSEDDYLTLKGKAATARMNAVGFLRECIRNAAVKARVSPDEMRCVRQLCGMANNLNQLAHRANAERYAKDAVVYRNVAYMIWSIANKCMGR